MWLLLVLIGLPAVEIYLFIEVGGALGAGWTLLLIVLTGLWGVHAMRLQGLTVLAEAQAAQAAGRPPLGAVAHGVLILAAGVMLVIPGFFTDMLGFLLMLKPIRSLLLESLLAALLPQIMRGFAVRRGTPAQKDDLPPGVIEGDYRVEDDEAPRS